MKLEDLIGYSLLAACLLETLLGIALLRRGGGDRVRRAAAGFSFVIAVYTLAAGLTYVTARDGRACDTLYRLCWFGWLALPTGLWVLHALRGTPRSRTRLPIAALAVFWATVLALALVTDLVDLAPARLLPFEDREGLLERPLRVLGGLNLCHVIVLLLRVRRDARGQAQLRLGYFLLGLLVFAVGAVVTAALLPVVGVPFDPALASLFALPSVVLTFVSITRDRLFDVATLLSRAVGLAVLLVVFGAAQLLLFTVLETYLQPTGAVALSFAVTATVLLATPVRAWLQNGIDHLLRRGRYQRHAVLHESARALVSILDADELMARLADIVSRGLGARSVAVYVTPDGATMALRHTHGERADAFPDVLGESAVAAVRAAVGATVPLPCAVAIGATLHPRCTAGARCSGLLALPLRYQGVLHGVMFVAPRADDVAWVAEDFAVLEALGSHAAVALANARLYREATTDDLTGLPHRKHFRLRLDEEHGRARRTDRALAVLMIDVDRFKRVNDTFGHAVGDRVLKGVAWTLLRTIRHPDVAARHGGEEFAVLLCDVSPASADRVAERIRQSVESERYAGGTAVTVSVGLAVQRPASDPATPAELLAAADAALYEAKRGGRNRVCRAATPGGGAVAVPERSAALARDGLPSS